MNIQQVRDIKLNFILTTARTGSTLLSLMLYSHPNITIALEEPFAYNLYKKYKNIKTWTSKTIQAYCDDFYLFSEGKLANRFVTKKEFENTLEAHKENLTAEIAVKLTYLCFFPNKDKSNITTIIDKQLQFHNCIDQIVSFYPQSKFIILYRDPRDNAYTKWRMFGSRKQLNTHNYYRIAWQWQNIFSKLASLKKTLSKNQLLEVKYEDLVENPEEELKKITSFLGVPYDAKMLEYDTNMKTEFSLLKEKQTANSPPVIMPIQKGIFEKPQTNKIGYWKQNLTTQQANLVWTICGTLAEKIGYKKDADFVKQAFPLKNLKIYLIILINKISSKLYYSSPSFLKYITKKIFYGKKAKTIKWKEAYYAAKSKAL